MFADETPAYHEGIPGHHLQISIQQRLIGLPEFRLYVINNAYAEGWAVYAEALGKEIGFFQDPAARAPGPIDGRELVSKRFEAQGESKLREPGSNEDTRSGWPGTRPSATL